jgi:hypothetical protein
MRENDFSPLRMLWGDEKGCLMDKKREKLLPRGIVHLGNKVFKGRCQTCKVERKDLSEYRNRFVCRDCLCPAYDSMTMAYLSMQATSRKWGGL